MVAAIALRAACPDVDRRLRERPPMVRKATQPSTRHHEHHERAERHQESGVGLGESGSALRPDPVSPAVAKSRIGCVFRALSSHAGHAVKVP